MIVHRWAATLIATILTLAWPAASPAAGGSAAPARLSQSAPSWLASTPSQSSVNPAPTASSPPRGMLPRTGFDLLPEVVLGAILLAGGVSLRVGLRARRM